MTTRTLFLLFAVAACSAPESPNDTNGGAGSAGQAPVAGTGGSGATGGSNAGSSGAGAPPVTGGSGGTSGASGGTAGASVGGSSGETTTGGAGGSASGAAGAGGSGGNDAGNGGSAGDAAGSGGAGTSGSGGSAGATDGMQMEEELAPLPAVRQEHAVVAAAGEIYVIGGYVMNSVSRSVIAYDPNEDEWRDVAEFPGPVQHPNAGVVNDKIIVAGFYMTTGTTSTSSQVFEYNPADDEWTERAPMPADTGRAAGCVAVDGGFMYVFGGAIDGTSVAFASRFDPAMNMWETLPPLPEPREHCAAGAVNGTLLVAGGRVDEIVNIEADTWAYDPTEMTWTPRAPMLRPRAGFAAAVLGGRFFTFGGEGNPDSNVGIFEDIDVYDPGIDMWEALSPMVIPRHGFGAATLDGRIYLAGGAIRQGGAASSEHSVFFFE